MSRREARSAATRERAAEPSRRSMRFRWRAPVVVAGARLAANPRRALLVATGVAAAIEVLIAVLAGSLATEDRTLQRTLSELPASQRAYRIDSFGLPAGESYAQTAAQARGMQQLRQRAAPAARDDVGRGLKYQVAQYVGHVSELAPVFFQASGIRR